MASATFRIGTATTNSAGTTWSWRAYDAKCDAATGSYCKLELESASGVRSIAYSIPTADEVTLASSATPTVTTNQSAKTATFQCSSSGPRTYIARAVINQGIDQRGNTISDYTKELAVHLRTTLGGRLLAVGETDQADRTYGYTSKVNDAIRGISSGVTQELTWVELIPTVDFATTAASTCTVTMSVDKTETLKPGIPVRVMDLYGLLLNNDYGA